VRQRTADVIRVVQSLHLKKEAKILTANDVLADFPPILSDKPDIYKSDKPDIYKSDKPDIYKKG
jgi:hypothetical protein